MTRKKTKKKVAIFSFSNALKADFKKLFVKSYLEMTPSDQEVFMSICSYCNETGKISYGQLRVVGCLYKKYLQDNEYVHHNWKIWKAKAAAAA